MNSKDIRLVLIALIGLAVTAVTVIFAAKTIGGDNITCTSSNCGRYNSTVGGTGGAPSALPSPTTSSAASSPTGGRP